MTDADLIARALERLETGHHFATMHIVTGYTSGYQYNISAPLAALIRKAAEPLRYRHADDVLQICHICRSRAHAPDCALIALCAAITGEKP